MPQLRLLVGSLLFAAASSACSGGPSIADPLVDGPFVGLRVQGVVQSADGVPVSGATLDVRARITTTCTGDVDHGQVTSATDGSFTRVLGRWGDPMDVCVWVAVFPPAGSGLAPDTVTVNPARLDFHDHALVVNVVLTALPETAP